MAVRSTQPLTEMITGDLPGCKIHVLMLCILCIEISLNMAIYR
jgi:hypothetical protein